METPTASEQLLGALGSFYRQITRLSLPELGVNLGLTLLVAALAWGLGLGFRRLVQLGVHKAPVAGDADTHMRASRVARFTRGVVGFGLFVAAVVLVARVWGLDIAAWLSAGVGEKLVAAAIRIGILLVIGFAVLEVIAFLVDRLLGRMAESASTQRRAGQLNTLAPLLRSFARGVVMVIFAMMVLSEAGVKIGPLLAGAGVVGIAVGFGAQTLVKDFLTGMFLIIEDIVSVGDIVNIGGFGGLVEEMTLRTIRLRDFDGTLHVFPYSEAQVIHNLTKTFSYYVFNLTVTYESDVDRALQIMRDTGAAMQAEPAFADKILEPIEVVGVDSFEDSGVLLKARVKTQPAAQWTVGREYNRRIKAAFEREGVEIAYPAMKLLTPVSAAPESLAETEASEPARRAQGARQG